MVAPNYSKNPEQPSSLHSLATATLAAAKLILDFRSRRTGHEIWDAELEPRLRPSLLQLLVDERTSKHAMGEAGFDLHLAKEGRCRVETCEGRRPLSAAKKRHDRAEARWLRARSALKEAADPLTRAENLLIARRLQELGRDFLALRTKYVSAFKEHERALERLDRASAEIGKWSGTSFCDVLSQITGDLVQLLDHQEHPPANFTESLNLADRLNALDHDAWKRLDIAVRKEAAAVEQEPPSENPAARSDPSEQATVGSITQPLSDPSQAPSRTGPRTLDLADLIPDPASSRTPSPSAMITPPSLPPTLAAFNVDPMGTMFRGPTVMGAFHERLQREADQARQIQSEIERMNLIQARANEQLDCMREIRDQLRAAAERERDDETAPVGAGGKAVRDERAALREHLDAVQGTNPYAFLRLVEEDGVLLGKISGRLDPAEQKTLRSIRAYCGRWNAEGGPHPSTLPPRPVGGDYIELKRWREDRSGHSELLDWNHASIMHLRGCWAAVLERLLALASPPPLEQSRQVATESTPTPPEDTNQKVGRVLRGWDAILPEFGLENERRNQVKIKRLNQRTRGPITWVGNKPTVFSVDLQGWIQRLRQGDERGEPETYADLELDHPAELKEKGFQTKLRPNNPGSFGKQSGYES